MAEGYRVSSDICRALAAGFDLGANVARFPFLSVANVKQKKELEETVRDKD